MAKTIDVELPVDIFDVQVNIPLIHQVVVAQLAAARQGSADTKSRGEVRGGGRKPYRQKGTGRARQGSIRAPAVQRRWRRPRPHAALVRPAHPQEDEGRRPARCPLRPGPQRTRPRRRVARRRQRALHQGGALHAARAHQPPPRAGGRQHRRHPHGQEPAQRPERRAAAVRPAQHLRRPAQRRPRLHQGRLRRVRGRPLRRGRRHDHAEQGRHRGREGSGQEGPGQEGPGRQEGPAKKAPAKKARPRRRPPRRRLPPRRPRPRRLPPRRRRPRRRPPRRLLPRRRPRRRPTRPPRRLPPRRRPPKKKTGDDK